MQLPPKALQLTSVKRRRPHQAAFVAKFDISPELVPGIDVSVFEDVDGIPFEGVAVRDASSVKRLVVWTQRVAHLNDQTMTPQTHIREDQGLDVLSFIRNQLVEERPKAATGAEGRAQPPTMDEMAVNVKAAKAKAMGPAGGVSQATSAAAAAALADIPDGDDSNDDTGAVSFMEVSSVAGISLAAVCASQGHRRPPARTLPAKRARQASAVQSSVPRGSRGARDVERLDGTSGSGLYAGSPSTLNPFGGNNTDDIQSELDKLPIYDILLCKTGGPTKMSIYNAVRAPAVPSPFADQAFYICGMLAQCIHVATRQAHGRCAGISSLALRREQQSDMICTQLPIAAPITTLRTGRKEQLQSTKRLTTGRRACCSLSTQPLLQRRSS